MSGRRSPGRRREERTPTCSRHACAGGFVSLRAWVCRVTGKGVRVVELQGEEQGRPPFLAQPVGYDGRSFYVGQDHGCDTEKLLHEMCHWLVARREERARENYGLGPGARTVDVPTSDNVEVTTMLLERLLAPHFRLHESCIARPDYNVHDRRNVDWSQCEQRARALYDACLPLQGA